jgi:hypothetical protein
MVGKAGLRRLGRLLSLDDEDRSLWPISQAV